MTIKKIWRDFHRYSESVLTWSINGEKTGSISFRVVGDPPSAIRLIYSITPRNAGQQDLDYPVNLTTTFTPWNALRWWFICPNLKCGRRVACLSLPPGKHYFACRLCYALTYLSSQEQHSSDSLYCFMAQMMQSHYPGVTPADMRYLFEEKEKYIKRPPQGGYYDQLIQEVISEFKNFDPWSQWLTAEQLAEQSGLTLIQLAELDDSRLLVPDHGERYRPKLAGWGCKLAYLLGEGWTLAEIKAWARGRWDTPNPRQFPPDRAAWHVD